MGASTTKPFDFRPFVDQTLTFHSYGVDHLCIVIFDFAPLSTAINRSFFGPWYLLAVLGRVLSARTVITALLKK